MNRFVKVKGNTSGRGLGDLDPRRRRMRLIHHSDRDGKMTGTLSFIRVRGKSAFH